MGVLGIVFISLLVSVIGFFMGLKSGRKVIKIASIILFFMCCALFLLIFTTMKNM